MNERKLSTREQSALRRIIRTEGTKVGLAERAGVHRQTLDAICAGARGHRGTLRAIRELMAESARD